MAKKKRRKSASERRKGWLSDIDDDLKREILHAESTRGAVLVSTAFIEEGLEYVLRAAFSKSCATMNEEYLNNLLLTSAKNPIPILGSFAARSKVAYAMGLISCDFRRGLDKLRSLRNGFAHRGEGTPRLTIKTMMEILVLVGDDRSRSFSFSEKEITKAEIERGYLAYTVWFILDRLKQLERRLRD